MQLELGNVVEGKVVKIADFGIFVDIGEGKTGMVHISEISNTYVKDINEHVSMGEVVKTKIINIANDGKIGLSIKQTMPKIEGGRAPQRGAQGDRKFQGRPRRDNNRTYSWQPKPTVKQEDMSFEDKMANFKQNSEEKMGEIKRSIETKRGSRSRGQR